VSETDGQSGGTVEPVLIHPPVARRYTSLEHPVGELTHLGDALGADCMVVEYLDGWVRPYRTDGAANEDWFGWSEPLLAPIDGVVEDIRDHPFTNEPGVMGTPPAAAITFSDSTGLRVVYGHIQAPRVAVGDSVTRGQVVAHIGNNGMCRHPHVHVGAWRRDQPLQVRFDLAALARVLGQPDTPSG
jgi:hypothetical protein